MEKHRKRLEKEISEVASKLRQVGIKPSSDEQAQHLESPSDSDLGDVAQVNEQRDLEFGTRVRLAERLNRLTAALERFDEDRYGICERCGERIQPARLDAIPEAACCRDCQEIVERLERAGQFDTVAEAAGAGRGAPRAR